MPELPEVELARGYLEAAVLCQPIEEVLVEDERILSRITPAEIEQHLAKRASAQFKGMVRGSFWSWTGGCGSQFIWA